MRIALGADHRGARTVEQVASLLRGDGHTVWVWPAGQPGQSSDYPDAAWHVGRRVAAGEADAGVLICGTGIGMSIAANKIPGVRAALAHDELTAQMSRGHNNANVLCLSADLLGQRLIEAIVRVWVETPFEGGRHERRVAKIGLIEHGSDPAGMGQPSQGAPGGASKGGARVAS